MATGTPVQSDLLCQKTETQLGILETCLNPSENKDYSFNALRAVTDAQRGDLLTSSPMMAKAGDVNCPDRHAYMKFLNPDCEEPVDAECPAYGCDVVEATKLEYTTVPIEINDCVYEEFAIDANLYDCTCESPINELQELLKRKVRALAKKMQKKVITKLHAGVGTSYDGVIGAQDLNLFTGGAQAKPNPMGWFPFNNEYSKQNPNCDETPYIISGSAKLQAYECSKTVFAGNTDGFDPNKSCFTSDRVYFDRTVQECLSTIDPALTNGAIAFLPGAVHIAEWFKYDNPNHIVTPTGRPIFAPMQSTGTLLRQRVDVGTPILGFPLEVDLQIQYVECDNKVMYRMWKPFEVCKLPQEAFCGTYNYCTLWNIACADTDCTILC